MTIGIPCGAFDILRRVAAVQNDAVEALLAGRGGVATDVLALVAVGPETICH